MTEEQAAKLIQMVTSIFYAVCILVGMKVGDWLRGR